MHTNAPTCSVIMPCYNHESYVAEAMQSILAQTYPCLELIVVDDASTDGSRGEITRIAATDERVVPILNDVNAGEGASRNAALAVARGEFIGFCDSDDRWLPDKLDHQLQQFRRDPDVGFVHADALLIDASGRRTGRRFSRVFGSSLPISGNVVSRLARRNSVSVPTVLIRRSVLDEGDRFRTDFRYLADWLFWLDVVPRTRVAYSRKPLAEYRVHSTSTMHDRSGFTPYRLRAYRTILRRSRELTSRDRAEILYRMAEQYRCSGRKFAAVVHYSLSVERRHTHLRSQLRRLLMYDFVRQLRT